MPSRDDIQRVWEKVMNGEVAATEEPEHADVDLTEDEADKAEEAAEPDKKAEDEDEAQSSSGSSFSSSSSSSDGAGSSKRPAKKPPKKGGAKAAPKSTSKKAPKAKGKTKTKPSTETASSTAVLVPKKRSSPQCLVQSSCVCVYGCVYKVPQTSICSITSCGPHRHIRYEVPQFPESDCGHRVSRQQKASLLSSCAACR